jgi:ferredoxin-type protein NapH
MEGRSWFRAILASLPIVLLTSFLMVGMISQHPLQRTADLIVWAFFNVMFFLIMKTGKTDRYRSLVFVMTAFFFIIYFATNILEARGSLGLTDANIVEGRAPFCHIVIPFALTPALLTKTIIFPGSMLHGFANIAFMIVIWVGATIALGRGWCSWVCFYGGLDEGFSRLPWPKRPVIKKIDHRWVYLPFGVLFTVALWSALTLTPQYCNWICPFKTVTEHPELDSIPAIIAAVIFIGLFLGLVVILPMLMKRRTQCGLFCPFGAMQSLTNKLNIFEVRIDRGKCKNCGLCVKRCPTFSLDEASLEKGKTRITCTKCGHCIDHCPSGAIYYHIKGTPINIGEGKARLIFLYAAFLFMFAMSCTIISGALGRILRLIFTGHMI